MSVLKPTVGEIETKLRAAQSALAAFESEHGAAALAAMSGGIGTQNRLDGLEAETMKARALVRTLEAAFKAAKLRDEEELRANRAALRKTQTAAMKAHLSTRDKAAEALTDALREAVKQWTLLFQHSEKARAACPIGSHWPEDGASAHGEIVRLVALEMRRLSGVAGLDAHASLPGSAPVTEIPPDMQTLLSEIKQASAFAMAAVTGKAAA